MSHRWKEAVILDSVTHIEPAHRGAVVVAASHAGRYAALYAAAKGVAAIILNDAGIGRERAGVAGLAALDEPGLPAAALCHLTARIGEGRHSAENGFVSVANQPALALGLTPGMTCREALAILRTAPPALSGTPAMEAESRHEIAIECERGPVTIIAIDSASLVVPADGGRIVVTGSHGGLLGGRPETAIKAPVKAAIYNDAGVGCDGAGTSRLPALDARGIAGVCVAAFSARIGDARSTYHDGYVSAVNNTARHMGAEIGSSCRDAVTRLAGASL